MFTGLVIVSVWLIEPDDLKEGHFAFGALVITCLMLILWIASLFVEFQDSNIETCKKQNNVMYCIHPPVRPATSEEIIKIKGTNK